MNKITDRSALFTTYTPRLLLGCVAILMLATNTGCVRMMANMIYMIKGNDAPAEFKELEEKKVAVLVSTNGQNVVQRTKLVDRYGLQIRRRQRSGFPQIASRVRLPADGSTGHGL